MITPPFTRYEFETRLTPGECRARLLPLIFFTKPFTISEQRPPQGHCYLFRGTVRENGFTLYRFDESISSKNQALLPMIRGRIVPHPTGVKISLTISVQASVLIYLAFVTTVVGLMSVAVFTTSPRSTFDYFPLLILLGQYTMLFYYYVTVYAPASNECRKILAELFEAK